MIKQSIGFPRSHSKSNSVSLVPQLRHHQLARVYLPNRIPFLCPPHSACSPTRCDTGHIALWKAGPSPNTRVFECVPSPRTLLPIDLPGSVFCLIQVSACSLLIRGDILYRFLTFLSFPSHHVYSLIELLNTHPLHWMVEGS